MSRLKCYASPILVIATKLAAAVFEDDCDTIVIIRARFEKGGLYWIGLFVILSVCHNFISAQYLENKLIEFRQICVML